MNEGDVARAGGERIRRENEAMRVFREDTLIGSI